MARQNRTKTADDAVVTNTEEPTVAENTTTETTEAPKAEIDLTAFKSAVDEAFTHADSTTGTIPEAEIAKVNEQYRLLEGLPAKNAARKVLDEGLMEAVGNLDAVKARGYGDLKGKLSAAGGSTTTKAPADPAAAYVAKRASLELALQIVNRQAPVIEGRDLDAEIAKAVSDASEQVEATLAYEADESEDKGDAPEQSPVVRAAFKVASGKGTGGTRRVSSGPRGDIAKHIQSAFADKESGEFLTVAEIAKHKSAEYSDGGPSQGAISARLFPASGKVTVEGVVPVDKDELGNGNPKGAKKA